MILGLLITGCFAPSVPFFSFRQTNYTVAGTPIRALPNHRGMDDFDQKVRLTGVQGPWVWPMVICIRVLWSALPHPPRMSRARASSLRYLRFVGDFLLVTPTTYRRERPSMGTWGERWRQCDSTRFDEMRASMSFHWLASGRASLLFLTVFSKSDVRIVTSTYQRRPITGGAPGFV